MDSSKPNKTNNARDKLNSISLGLKAKEKSKNTESKETPVSKGLQTQQKASSNILDDNGFKLKTKLYKGSIFSTLSSKLFSFCDSFSLSWKDLINDTSALINSTTNSSETLKNSVVGFLLNKINSYSRFSVFKNNQNHTSYKNNNIDLDYKNKFENKNFSRNIRSDSGKTHDETIQIKSNILDKLNKCELCGYKDESGSSDPSMLCYCLKQKTCHSLSAYLPTTDILIKINSYLHLIIILVMIITSSSDFSTVIIMLCYLIFNFNLTSRYNSNSNNSSIINLNTSNKDKSSTYLFNGNNSEDFINNTSRIEFKDVFSSNNLHLNANSNGLKYNSVSENNTLISNIKNINLNLDKNSSNIIAKKNKECSKSSNLSIIVSKNSNILSNTYQSRQSFTSNGKIFKSVDKNYEESQNIRSNKKIKLIGKTITSPNYNIFVNENKENYYKFKKILNNRNNKNAISEDNKVTSDSRSFCSNRSNKSETHTNTNDNKKYFMGLFSSDSVFEDEKEYFINNNANNVKKYSFTEERKLMFLNHLNQITKDENNNEFDTNKAINDKNENIINNFHRNPNNKTNTNNNNSEFSLSEICSNKLSNYLSNENLLEKDDSKINSNLTTKNLLAHEKNEQDNSKNNTNSLNRRKSVYFEFNKNNNSNKQQLESINSNINTGINSNNSTIESNEIVKTKISFTSQYFLAQSIYRFILFLNFTYKYFFHLKSETYNHRYNNVNNVDNINNEYNLYLSMSRFFYLQLFISFFELTVIKKTKIANIYIISFINLFSQLIIFKVIVNPQVLILELFILILVFVAILVVRKFLLLFGSYLDIVSLLLVRSKFLISNNINSNNKNNKNQCTNEPVIDNDSFENDLVLMKPNTKTDFLTDNTVIDFRNNRNSKEVNNNAASNSKDLNLSKNISKVKYSPSFVINVKEIPKYFFNSNKSINKAKIKSNRSIKSIKPSKSKRSSRKDNFNLLVSDKNNDNSINMKKYNLAINDVEYENLKYNNIIKHHYREDDNDNNEVIDYSNVRSSINYNNDDNKVKSFTNKIDANKLSPFKTKDNNKHTTTISTNFSSNIHSINNNIKNKNNSNTLLSSSINNHQVNNNLNSGIIKNNETNITIGSFLAEEDFLPTSVFESLSFPIVVLQYNSSKRYTYGKLTSVFNNKSFEKEFIQDNDKIENNDNVNNTSNNNISVNSSTVHTNKNLNINNNNNYINKNISQNSLSYSNAMTNMISKNSNNNVTTTNIRDTSHSPNINIMLSSKNLNFNQNVNNQTINNLEIEHDLKEKLLNLFIFQSEISEKVSVNMESSSSVVEKLNQNKLFPVEYEDDEILESNSCSNYSEKTSDENNESDNESEDRNNKIISENNEDTANKPDEICIYDKARTRIEFINNSKKSINVLNNSSLDNDISTNKKYTQNIILNEPSSKSSEEEDANFEFTNIHNSIINQKDNIIVTNSYNSNKNAISNFNDFSAINNNNVSNTYIKNKFSNNSINDIISMSSNNNLCLDPINTNFSKPRSSFISHNPNNIENQNFVSNRYFNLPFNNNKPISNNNYNINKHKDFTKEKRNSYNYNNLNNKTMLFNNTSQINNINNKKLTVNSHNIQNTINSNYFRNRRQSMNMSSKIALLDQKKENEDTTLYNYLIHRIKKHINKLTSLKSFTNNKNSNQKFYKRNIFKNTNNNNYYMIEIHNINTLNNNPSNIYNNITTERTNNNNSNKHIRSFKTNKSNNNKNSVNNSIYPIGELSKVEKPKNYFQVVFINVTHFVNLHLKDNENTKIMRTKLAHTAHEFKTPLNAIIDISNNMKNKIITNDKDIFEEVENINSISNYTFFLITDFIQTSKGNSDLAIALNNCSIHKILVFSYNVGKTLLSYFYGKSKVKFELEIEDSLNDVTLKTDEIRLKQVLLNFISNAVKFTNKGLIKISCFRKDENSIEIKIKDSGAGMDEDTITKINKANFESINIDRKVNSTGTGIGLNLSFNILNKLEYKTEIQSKLKKGTTISILIGNNHLVETLDNFKSMESFNYHNSAINNINNSVLTNLRKSSEKKEDSVKQDSNNINNTNNTVNNGSIKISENENASLNNKDSKFLQPNSNNNTLINDSLKLRKEYYESSNLKIPYNSHHLQVNDRISIKTVKLNSLRSFKQIRKSFTKKRKVHKKYSFTRPKFRYDKFDIHSSAIPESFKINKSKRNVIGNSSNKLLKVGFKSASVRCNIDEENSTNFEIEKTFSNESIGLKKFCLYNTIGFKKALITKSKHDSGKYNCIVSKENSVDTVRLYKTSPLLKPKSIFPKIIKQELLASEKKIRDKNHNISNFQLKIYNEMNNDITSELVQEQDVVSKYPEKENKRTSSASTFIYKNKALNNAFRTSIAKNSNNNTINDSKNLNQGKQNLSHNYDNDNNASFISNNTVYQKKNTKFFTTDKRNYSNKIKKLFKNSHYLTSKNFKLSNFNDDNNDNDNKKIQANVNFISLESKKIKSLEDLSLKETKIKDNFKDNNEKEKIPSRFSNSTIQQNFEPDYEFLYSKLFPDENNIHKVIFKDNKKIGYSQNSSVTCLCDPQFISNQENSDSEDSSSDDNYHAIDKGELSFDDSKNFKFKKRKYSSSKSVADEFANNESSRNIQVRIAKNSNINSSQRYISNNNNNYNDCKKKRKVSSLSLKIEKTSAINIIVNLSNKQNEINKEIVNKESSSAILNNEFILTESDEKEFFLKAKKSNKKVLNYKGEKFKLIIVIDDVFLIRKSLRNNIKGVLKELGMENEYMVISGNDGSDLIWYICEDQDNQNIKIIFSDENMEFVNGSKAVSIIKESQNNNKLKYIPHLICSTNFEDESIKQKILDAGFDRLIDKSIPKKLLKEIISDILSE